MKLNEKMILNAFMQEHGETLKSVADKAGANNRTLSNKLGRADSTLSLTTMYSLMKAMGVDIVFRDADGVEHVLSDSDEPIVPDTSRLEEKKQSTVEAIKSGMKPPTK